jgi:hypothetical protein
MILKWLLKKLGMNLLTGFIWLKVEVAYFRENLNDPSGQPMKVT